MATIQSLFNEARRETLALGRDYVSLTEARAKWGARHMAIGGGALGLGVLLAALALAQLVFGAVERGLAADAVLADQGRFVLIAGAILIVPAALLMIVGALNLKRAAHTIKP